MVLFKRKNKNQAEYFNKYQVSKGFERTYGWAWLFQLDAELASWENPQAKTWHQNLKPLTDEIKIVERIFTETNVSQ